MVCEMRADVKGYGEDAQIHMQYFPYRLQLVLDWCEEVSHSLKIPLPIMLERNHLSIPIILSNKVILILDDLDQDDGCPKAPGQQKI